jgi:hypothetical protein
LSASTDARRGPAGEARQALADWLTRAVWLLPALSLVVIVGIFAPRFSVNSASLVDDWFALTYAPTATHQLLHGHYDATAIDYGGRYRPSYALLGELQWMFGSRSSTLIPTIVGLVRLLFFAGAVAATVIAVLRRVASRQSLIVAASFVPAAVVATRGVSYNFVRFGIDEPTAFAALALGLVGMTVAVRNLVCARNGPVPRHSATIFVASYILYAFGAYMTEASAAVVVLLPALYYWMSREPTFVRGRRSKAILATAAVLILAPIAHVLSEIAPSLGQEGHGGRSLAGLVTQLVSPASSTSLGVMKTASLVWPVLIAVALAATTRRALQKDRLAVLLLGMMLSGFAFAYVANLGTSGNALSRYYIPLLVAVGIACMWLLESRQPATRTFILAFVLALVLAGRGDLVARNWLKLDHAGDKAIALASEAYASKCPVYLVDFPDERRMGLARVLEGQPERSLERCAEPDSTAYAIRWQIDSPTGVPTYPGRCKTRWRRVAQGSSVELARCSNFSPQGLIRTQDTLTTSRVVRLVPPTHWIDASALNRLAYVNP